MYLDEKCVLGKSEEAYKSYLEDLNIEKSKSINGYFGNRWLLIVIRKETYGGCSEKNKSSNGLDIQKNDDNEAFSWLLKAANYGDTDAQFLVALMYLNGVGVAISDSSAFSWLSKLANNGHILSQYYLALFYQNGWGVGINYQETIKWLSSAAEQNNADAQFMLGNMYEQGNGVTKDLNKANEWYKKSADNDGSAAKVLLGIHPSQLFLAQNVQNSSKPRFPRESDLEEIIYKKLADAGDLNSILFIARMTKNEKDSYLLYKKAAELGSLNAQYRMWQLNIAGVEGVIEADIYSANKWLFMSANNGHELSQLTLASSYYDGEPSFGIIQDYEKSFYWYNKLLKVNNVSAINKIASIRAIAL